MMNIATSFIRVNRLKEYIYKLTLIHRLLKTENWTKSDEEITADHFSYLKDLLEKDQLILAGKTAGLDTDTYGLVLFKAANYDEAMKIMKNDPAVQNGIMSGYLQEYSIALLNNHFKK